MAFVRLADRRGMLLDCDTAGEGDCCSVRVRWKAVEGDGKVEDPDGLFENNVRGSSSSEVTGIAATEADKARDSKQDASLAHQ